METDQEFFFLVTIEIFHSWNVTIAGDYLMKLVS